MDRGTRKGSRAANTLMSFSAGCRSQTKCAQSATIGTEAYRASHPTSIGSYIRTVISSESASIDGKVRGAPVLLFGCDLRHGPAWSTRRHHRFDAFVALKAASQLKYCGDLLTRALQHPQSK